jgi:H+/gluconate symporter-like permease
MLGIFGIVLSLVLLMVLAYRGISVIILAPLMAMLAVLFDGDMPLLASYTQIFMGALGRFIVSYFPLFLLGAIFGKLMEDSGSAAAIARTIASSLGSHRAIAAIVVACAVLTYGGVSLFVVVFAIYPLAAALFRQADIPKRLLPATIALGSFTFTMTSLPGSVQIHNLIPMRFFHTTAFAAPLLGTFGGLLMFALGMLWLSVRARTAQQAGEGYGESPLQEPKVSTDTPLPGTATALAPIFVVIALNYVLSQYVVPHWSVGYLAEVRFGATQLSSVMGVWSTLLALLAAICLLMVSHYRSRRRLNEALTAGATSSMLPIFNTASEVGYGATIAAVGAFASLKHAVLNIAPSNPLISESIAVNLMAGITGSASGGLTIALEALGNTYYDHAAAAHVNPELLHRIAAMSCGGLDTLPHNGAVITLLLICGLTHRQSYKDIAVVSLVVPLISTAAVLIIGTLAGAF